MLKKPHDYLRRSRKNNNTIPSIIRINPITTEYGILKMLNKSLITIIKIPKNIKKIGNMTLAFCIILSNDNIIIPLINFLYLGVKDI
jgi:hypothetical protein